MKTLRFIALVAMICFASNLRAANPVRHGVTDSFTGKTRAQVQQILKEDGYKLHKNGNSKIFTKDRGDGTTDAVRLDPAKKQIPSRGYADEVPHAHKETVPTSEVRNGNYFQPNKAKGVQKFDDAGNPSTDPADVHIPVQTRSSARATKIGKTVASPPPPEPAGASPGSPPHSPANPPAPEGPASSAPEPAAGVKGRSVVSPSNVLGAVGLTAMAFNGAAQEGERAMQAGEAPNRLRAAANAIGEVSMVPAIIRGVEYGGNLRDKHVEQAERKYGPGIKSELAGRATALGEFAGDLTGWNSGSQIGQEEIQNEERQAAREGREPDYRRSMLNGSARGLGEVVGIGTIARSAHSVTEEEVTWQGQQQVMQAWVQRKANESLKEMNAVKRRQGQMAAHGNPHDPKFRQELTELSRRYDKARTDLHNVSDAAGRQLGDDDPLTRSVRDRGAHLPATPAENDIGNVVSQPEPAAPTSNSGTEDPQGGDEDDPEDGWDELPMHGPPKDDSRYYEQRPLQNTPTMPPSSHGPECNCPECKGKASDNTVPPGIVVSGPEENMQNVAGEEDSKNAAEMDADDSDEADDADETQNADQTADDADETDADAQMHDADTMDDADDADDDADSADADDADDMDDSPADDDDVMDEPVHDDE